MKKEALLETVQKIIRHPSFGRSDTYANLLLFLAECTLENRIPKETDIATAIFAKKDFDPSQSTQVRVYVYKLRKKILQYYQSEDVKERYRLSIPKGSYKVVLEESTSSFPTNFTPRAYRFLWAAVGVLLLSGSLAVFYKIGKKEPYVPLEDFYSSDSPTIVALGDYFLFREKHPDKVFPRFIRTDLITSTSGFEHFVQNESDSTLQYGKVNTTTIPFEISNCIKTLSASFARQEVDFGLKRNNGFDTELLKDHNIIAVGTLNNLTKFNKIPYHYTYQLHDKYKHKLIYNNKEKDILAEYRPSYDQDSRTDYCVVSKTRGPNGNEIMVFGSLWSIALEPAINHFTKIPLQEALLKKLSTPNNEVPKYFELLLQVTSIGNTAVDAEIVQFDILDEQQTTWE